MRLFIGLPCEEKAALALAENVRLLKSSAPTLRYYDKAQYHLTLAFLGEQPEALLKPLAEKLDTALATHNPIDWACTHIAPFPKARPTVLAAWVAPTDALSHLAKTIVDVCQQLNLPLSQRFSPHVTLARPRKPSSIPACHVPVSIACQATSVIVYQSVPTPAGSQYLPLHMIQLQI